MLCSKCGTSNDEAASVCVKCGYEFPPPVQSVPKVRARVEDVVSEDEYYKAILGPKNQDYYLDRFSRFDDEGKTSATWHWPAFLTTFYWMLYRKMWLSALFYFLLPYAFMLLFGIVAAVAGGTSAGLLSIGYLAVVFILIPMYANTLYYNQCKKTIAAVRATTLGTQRQLGELSGKGGTSGTVIVVVLVFTLIGFIGVLAAIAIPAYQDFTIKARTLEAMNVGKSAENFVDNYYSQYKSIPRSLEVSGIEASLPPSVKEVSLDSQTGAITITMIGATAIDGKTLKLVPALDGSDQLSWTCMSDEIKDRYLPRECQHGR